MMRTRAFLLYLHETRRLGGYVGEHAIVADTAANDTDWTTGRETKPVNDPAWKDGGCSPLKPSSFGLMRDWIDRCWENPI